MNKLLGISILILLNSVLCYIIDEPPVLSDQLLHTTENENKIQSKIDRKENGLLESGEVTIEKENVSVVNEENENDIDDSILEEQPANLKVSDDFNSTTTEETKDNSDDDNDDIDDIVDSILDEALQYINSTNQTLTNTSRPYDDSDDDDDDLFYKIAFNETDFNLNLWNETGTENPDDDNVDDNEHLSTAVEENTEEITRDTIIKYASTVVTDNYSITLKSSVYLMMLSLLFMYLW